MAAGKEEGDLGEYRNKLLSFLDISSSYEPARLISDFPFDGERPTPSRASGRQTSWQLRL